MEDLARPPVAEAKVPTTTNVVLRGLDFKRTWQAPGPGLANPVEPVSRWIAADDRYRAPG